MLKLHNTEKEVSGTVIVKSQSDNKVNVSAELSLKLSDFNIEIPSYKGITVAEKVKIKISTTIIKNLGGVKVTSN